MKITESQLAADVGALRSSRVPSDRALGDNVVMEERVAEQRRDVFQSVKGSNGTIREALGNYFLARVQGFRRGHISDTFASVNREAVWEADVDPNQIIVRMERIDDVLNKAGLAFEDLEKEVGTDSFNLRSAIIEQFNMFRGERPAFCAFRSELASRLGGVDWYFEIRNCLGLGHLTPTGGSSTVTVALMEYSAGDVLDAASALGVRRPFAIPTVLDSAPSAWFFPGPRNLEANYTVSLNGLHEDEKMVREMLHVRIAYRPEHLKKVARFSALPVPDAKLGNARDAHLAVLRAECGDGAFGWMMKGEVDE